MTVAGPSAKPLADGLARRRGGHPCPRPDQGYVVAIGVLTLTGSTGWLTAAGWVGEAELASLVHQAGIRRQL